MFREVSDGFEEAYEEGGVVEEVRVVEEGGVVEQEDSMP